MNEVVGLGNWRAHRTVTVKQVTRSNGRTAFEAVCDITLELGEWIDGTFVAWAEALSDGGHTASSEADARKGAFTNGLKKAAAMFGCGRQAYEGTLDDDNIPTEHSSDGFTVSTLPTQRPAPAPAPVVQVPAAQQAQAAPSPRPQVPQSPAPTRNRLTGKQLACIQAIARKLGYDPQGLRAFVKGQFGAQPEFLSRDQASKLISAMSAQAGNGQAHEQHEPGVEG